MQHIIEFDIKSVLYHFLKGSLSFLTKGVDFLSPQVKMEFIGSKVYRFSIFNNYSPKPLSHYQVQKQRFLGHLSFQIRTL